MEKTQNFIFKMAPIVTTGIFIVPIAVGLLGTWLPAFGWLPAIGANHFSLESWVNLIHHPNFIGAVTKTLFTGLGTVILVFILNLTILVGAYPSKLFITIEKFLAPILSMPHAAFAIGIGFLIAPSGWLVRCIHFATNNFEQPPNWMTFQDPSGYSLILTLVLKETPFLLFMSLAALPSLNVDKTITIAKSLGRSTRFAWFWLIFPQLYKNLKFPIFAITAYSLTVIDIALIAGPTTPPTLAVLVNNLFNNSTLEFKLIGAAGATFLLGLVIGSLILLLFIERTLKCLRIFALSTKKMIRLNFEWEPLGAKIISSYFAIMFITTSVITLFWSISASWRYPDIIPESFSIRSWLKFFDRISDPFWNSLSLALLSALIALSLTVIALENELRLKRQSKSINTQSIILTLYIPLLVPQIAFIFGFHVLLIFLHLDAKYFSVLWSHLIFVVPYVFLTLSGPYRKFDHRFYLQAISLNKSSWRFYWKIKFQILLRPILYAFAIGFSVSIAQYLPTLFIGAGKYSTITTEAVALSSGSDRRMIAVVAMCQQALPLLIFLLAIVIPNIRFRHRRAMRNTLE